MRRYGYVDRDSDGYTAPEAGEVCTGATLPDPYRASAKGNDCSDSDTSQYRWVVMHRDLDGDGIGAGPRSVFCLGNCLPPGWSIFGYDPDDGDPAVQSSEDDDLLAQF